MRCQGNYSIISLESVANFTPVKLHRKAQHSEVVSSQQVITPHALPLFRQERRKTSRKQMEKDRLDPVKSKRPDLPITSGQGKSQY